MSFSVEGKSVIVTGAAAGVGLAIARNFARAGARVMMAGQNEDLLEAEAAQLREHDCDVQSFAGDLKEKLCVANLLAATLDAFDRLDILINASRDTQTTDPLDADDNSFETLIAQNVTATMRLSQAAAKRMISQAEKSDDEGEAGSIVNVTSIVSQRTVPEMMSYSVAAAALDQLTRSMAVALAQHRIRVNAIALGSVMSSALKDALKGRDNLIEDLAAVTPLGRIGEAAEAAEAAVFLASDSASFITGQILAVDGGRSMFDPMDSPAT